MSKYGKEESEVEQQYESLTRLARPGDWPRATDELEDNTTFADGVIGRSLGHFYPARNSHVPGHGWSFYEGTPNADFDYYIVSDRLPQSWTAYGCAAKDFREIVAAFDSNPFMLGEVEVTENGG